MNKENVVVELEDQAKQINPKNYKKFMEKLQTVNNTDISKGYISRSEATRRYNISYGALRHNEKKGVIKTYNNGNRLTFLEIESIEKYIEFLKYIERINNDENWIKVSSVREKPCYDMIINAIRKNDFENDLIKVDRGKNNEFFITRKLYKEILSGKYKIIVTSKQKKEILKDDIEGIITKLLIETGVNSNRKKGKMKQLIKVKEISELSGIDYEEIIKSIGYFNGEIVKEQNIEYIHRYDVENIMKNFGFYSIRILSKICQIPFQTLTRDFSIANFLGIYINFKIDIDFFVDINGVEITLKEFSKNYIATLTIEEIYRERMKLFPDDFSKTYELADEFIVNKKRNCYRPYGEDTTSYNRVINSIENLVNYLDKEIFEYSSEELLKLVSNTNIVKRGYQPLTCQFINYVKKKMRNDCEYNKVFGLTLLRQYKIENGEKCLEKIYDKETWSKYYILLKDTDKHIVNAIKDPRYAQSWLYCILNLSVTWRKKNIILSLPRIKLEEIGVYEFQWFLQENVFSRSMAELALNQIKFSLDGVIAYKNRRNLHINIPMSLKIPTAISFIICEIHCREKNKENLMYELAQSDIRKSDYKKLFEDDKLLNFENLKCTRSIISYGFSHAINTIGTVPAAYKIYSNRRSHSDSEQKITNVTGDHYIALDGIENGAKEFMFHIVERGAFGFMYYKLFQCFFDKKDFENLSQKQLTDLTMYSDEILNPRTLENVADNFIENDGINKFSIFEILWYSSIIKNKGKKDLSSKKNSFLAIMIDLYKKQAKNLFGKSDGFETFIEDKYLQVDAEIEDILKNKINTSKVIENIFKGSNCCYSKDTNCIFDRIERKELCPYKYEDNGGESCVGCKYNLLIVYALNEINEKIQMLLDKIQKKSHFTKEEIQKNSYILKNYISIILEASVHFKNDEFLSNYINLKMIKTKIYKLKSEDKIINI
ncbi:hypothetical protein [Clostridium beijerinckii]|uniref:hypothetical protein n=1 Tax=Clostridium beijerinckii TaxID=1520 RepID=UPI00242E5C9A|nr:hypothetical protein [Clostridium beijerinckii]MDG5855257.1 hypothetical protein [Clostridium beijerinckii]